MEALSLPRSAKFCLALISLQQKVAFAASKSSEDTECVFLSDHFSKFDLTSLEKPSDQPYESDATVSNAIKFKFNFCASIDNTSDNRVEVINLETGQDYTYAGPAEHEAYLKPYGDEVHGSRGKGVVRGVRLIYTSDVECEESVNHGVTIAVECSKHNDKSLTGYISEVNNAQSCHPTLVFKHISGCPDYYISDFTWNNYWKPYLLGLVLTAMGLFLGCMGKNMFHTVVPLSQALFAGLALLYTISVWTTWCKSTLGFILTLTVLALSVLAMTFTLKS